MTFIWFISLKGRDKQRTSYVSRALNKPDLSSIKNIKTEFETETWVLWTDKRSLSYETKTKI